MIDIHLQNRFETALAANQLVELVQQMRAEGLSQVEIYHRFDTFRDFLRQADREQAEDQVMDVMDRIVGWCSPGASLFDHYLTNEEIAEFVNYRLLDL